jgi:hypothetical protein
MLCIGLGLTFNEYLLTYLFSEDGDVGLSIRLSIWVFDVLCAGFGLLIIFSKSLRLVVTKLELINDIVNNFNYFIRVILTVLISVLLFAQIAYLVSAIHENQDNQGIIYSVDPDAGTNIYSALSVKGGSSLNHGVLYQKIAHYLAWSSPVFNSVDTENEKNEKRVHFSLVLISLFSIYLFSFLLASLISNEIIYKLLGILLISATFLSESTWCNYVLRVHPDMLLALLSALFIFLIYRSKFKTNSKFLYLACLVAGACLATKPIFFLFLPGLIFIELPPVTNKKVINLIKLYLLIVVSYFILAFPLFFTTIKSLVGVRAVMSTVPTLESIMDWWTLLITQGWLPLVMLFILSLFFVKKLPENQKRDKYMFLRIWAVAFIPFILLITQNSEFPVSHWTLPFVSILLTAFAIWLPYLNFGWVAKIRSWFSRDLPKYAMAIILLISFEMTVGIMPANVNVVLSELMAGRKEVSSMYKIVNNYLEQGKIVFVNPYIPYNHSAPRSPIGPTDLTMEILKTPDLDILFLSRKRWYSRYVEDEVSDYMKIGRPDWQEIRELYSLFFGKSETIDPLGQEWIKIHEDNNGIEIWREK